MTTLTLLAPYLGTTQVIWASVIGATLLYLSAGYLVGGRWADRWPHTQSLCTLMALAGIAVSLVPWLCRPVLQVCLRAHSMAAMAAGLVACLLILAVPMTLLGMVSPYAIKLAVRSVQDAGRTAGNLFALSTLGSLLGTFGPVLWLTPWLGTARTFSVLGFLLSLASLPELRRSPQRLWLLSLAGILMQLWLLGHPPASIRAAEGAEVVYEAQSLYNYIQVRQRQHPAGGQVRQLYLNESWAAHSVYHNRFESSHNPEHLLVHTYWDYVPIAPFTYPDRSEHSIKSLAMIGLGAGTIPQLFLALYGPESEIDGVEIDPQVIAVGRQFFGLKDNSPQFPHFQTHSMDGRVFINQMNRKYDLIVIDCFRWPYVPSHLVTRECFETARQHLNPQGTLVIKCDRGLMGNRITATLKSCFPQVFQLLGMAIAVNQPVGDGLANLKSNAATVQNPSLRKILLEAIATEADRTRPFREWKDATAPLTDDHSPTEFLVHQGAIARYMASGASHSQRHSP